MHKHLRLIKNFLIFQLVQVQLLMSNVLQEINAADVVTSQAYVLFYKRRKMVDC